MRIKEQIEFQGLRKSGQMHKVRLTQNNYQLVAENSGQSPEVLMSNYNEALDSEKHALALLIEDSFYPQSEGTAESLQASNQAEAVLQMLRENPELFDQVLEALLSHAADAVSVTERQRFLTVGKVTRKTTSTLYDKKNSA